jgi:hypothetical protein
VAEGCRRYEALLTDASTFASMTIEDFVDAGALPTQAATLVRERCLA